MKKLILASASPRRKELLHEAGYFFEIRKSLIQETLNPNLSPKENAIALAKQKAFDVSQRNQGIILAADTLVVVQNHVLGKPKDLKEACHMLSLLSGNTQEVITGFCVFDTDTQNSVCNAVSTKIIFRKLTEEEIKNYVETEKPLDKAGAYAIQEKGDAFIEKMEGSVSNVVGLPMEEVGKILETFGILRGG
ncbi:MAG: septum formation protein Maf [Deltaproteobacteria bacterium RIFCSPHIGHO2_02_FULL_40_11]|nr:MAG: septum formation protein Maf [Deltaproteobacteria bacterium RIFCSPHIGHO2_02_FULL_40_11]